MSDLTPGTQIAGRYEIVNSIGEGGMQKVYRARDHAFGRDVALKIPKNSSAQKRFKRSAIVAARIVHPNVARTIDYIKGETSDVLVEEFISGYDLQKRMNDDFFFLDPHLAAHVFHHLVKGLAASHHVGVIHRDLKPSNMMVSGDPSIAELKLTDFGIAKMAQGEIEEVMEKGEESITGSQTVVGALPYMAPEMITDSKNAGKPADVWACGAILFYLLASKKPFGEGLQAIPKIVAAKIPKRETVLGSRAQFEHLNQSLWELIENCLQLDPANRPTADQLVLSMSAICYSLAPRMVGKIYNYGSFRGDFGFILSAGAGEVFFHADSFYGRPIKDGTIVNFAAFDGTPKPRAHPVLPIRRLK